MQHSLSWGRPVKHPFNRGPQQTVITIYCPSDVDQMQHSLSWGRPVKHLFYRGPQQTVITIYCPSMISGTAPILWGATTDSNHNLLPIISGTVFAKGKLITITAFDALLTSFYNFCTFSVLVVVSF